MLDASLHNNLQLGFKNKIGGNKPAVKAAFTNMASGAFAEKTIRGNKKWEQFFDSQSNINNVSFADNQSAGAHDRTMDMLRSSIGDKGGK